MDQSKNRFKKNKGAVIVTCIPIVTFIVIELVCNIFTGRHLIETSLDVTNFLRQVSINILAGYALLLNMGNGRMDISLGGQKLVACLIGGNLALSMGMGVAGVILMSILFGMISGLLTGVLYVTLRLPAMILGIGTALIFEAVAAAYAPEGFQLYGRQNMGMLSNVTLITICGVVSIAVMYILMDKSKFGIQYRAIAGSQKIAHTSGVKIYGKTVIIYCICGALMSLSGILETGVSGYQSPAMNLSSITIAFTSFVPVFAAMIMQKWISTVFGVPVAVITFRILTMGITLFRLPSAASAVITMGVLVLLLLIMNLVTAREKKKAEGLRIAAAQQA
ncbi:ABC transporter permease [Diplocloster modestus]|uniref:ABC transporter permease n=1 Tax=Diplocloster modestus TaxID=2850322 RepID=A0ABS6KEI6_9FIRM|nr:ABC transporter permease [Diplocloster modestus]MBU9728889.1 hypothetical protein [Diplocloster modestus]